MPHATNGRDAESAEKAASDAPSPSRQQQQQDASTAAAAGASAAAAALGATAFRAAEKRYQLHLDQKIHIG
jgi:hypothetical protein